MTALFCLIPTAAQAQAVEAWVQRYNGPGNGTDRPYAIAVSSGGNVYVTGSTYGLSGDDYATIAYSSAGVPLWTNLYDGPGNAGDTAKAMAVDASGNIFVTGGSYGSGTYSDIATIKYSSAGVPLWTNRYNGPVNYSDGARAAAVDASGNVVVAGSSQTGYGKTDYVTIKYSSGGVPLWTNFYNNADGIAGACSVAVDASGNVVVVGSIFATIKYSGGGVPLWTNLYIQGFCNAMAMDSSGNLVVTGRAQDAVGPGTGNDFVTIKYSSEGTPLWTNFYNGPANGFEEATAVAVDASGNVYVTGISSGSGTSTDYATVAYSSAGVPLWTNRYNGPGNGTDEATAVAVDASGNVYVTGISSGSGTSADYATVAYSSAGVPLWTNRYNGPGNGIDYPNAMVVDASGDVYVTGSSVGSGSGVDIATVKYLNLIPPIITRQPLSQTNAVGTTANFTIEVAGSAPFFYQWRLQGTNLLDGGNVSRVATTNLLIANVQPADTGGYTVVVTNTYGSITSSVAQLTVVNPGRFSSLSYSPAMGFSFIFRDATVGRPYRIQRSPSMAEGSWVDWQSFTYTEPIALIDLGATSAERRFYRAVSP